MKKKKKKSGCYCLALPCLAYKEGERKESRYVLSHERKQKMLDPGGGGGGRCCFAASFTSLKKARILGLV